MCIDRLVLHVINKDIEIKLDILDKEQTYCIGDTEETAAKPHSVIKKLFECFNRREVFAIRKT